MKQIIYRTIPVIIIFALLVFCSGKKKSNKQETQDSQPSYENFEKGKILDHIVCLKDTTQSYALYLPSDYSTNKKYPVIYAFDASARGSFPLKRYKNLAEKYGYILIGSNSSRNKLDWNTINNISSTLFEDTRQRISIDEKRIYTSGFSGGARVATSIALSNGSVNGVISCAAGFPSMDKPPQTTFSYLAIVGNEDFNYLELVNLDKALDNSPMRHFLLVYDGKHDWAATEVFEEALLWTEFNAMRDQLIPTNDKLIKDFTDRQELKIKQYSGAGNPYELYNVYKKLIIFLDGISDVSGYKKKSEEVSKSKEFLNLTNHLDELRKKEENQQSIYSNAFSNKDINWWKNEISNLNNFANGQGNAYDKLTYKRLLNYIGLLAHLNYDAAVKNNAEDQAFHFLQVKNTVQPNEPISSYLFAGYYARKNDYDQSLQYLEKAVNLGFDDFLQISGDANFTALKGNSKFAELLRRIEANAK